LDIQGLGIFRVLLLWENDPKILEIRNKMDYNKIKLGININCDIQGFGAFRDLIFLRNTQKI
jgi:hypothetical protein